MEFQLQYSTKARDVLSNLKHIDPKKHKKALKTLGLMQTNLRHPSLKSHKYLSLSGPKGEEIFEAYIENKTSAAFRVFWYYGPNKSIITIYSITPHP